jgi:rod shape-determining protein MreC
VNAQRGRAVFVILILALVLAWIVLDQTGESNPIRDGFSRVISPLQFALKRASGPVGSVLSWISHLTTLDQTNQMLRKENTELRNQIILLQEAQTENETLRRQLDFKSAVPSLRLLSAEVIGRDPNNLLQYLIIDRGAEDGIQKAMPVLAAEGLVGRVSEVSANSAKVMLITDPSSSVSALIQSSRSTGMVQGSPGAELTMRYIPQGDMVSPGDVAITSGLGGNFPKRLVIGQVANVKKKDVEMFQEARIIPAVNLSDLEVVMVLLSFKPSDMAQDNTGK